MLEEALTQVIIAALIEVHKFLGPGLMESAYRNCLCHELESRGLKVAREVALPVVYKGLRLDCGYRLDVVVEGKVILELKAVENLAPIHEAQRISYLRLSGIRVGMLVNFNVKLITKGIVRRVL